MSVNSIKIITITKQTLDFSVVRRLRSVTVACLADMRMGNLLQDVGTALESAGFAEPDAEVVLSRELVGLLSAQLYQSPIKAIEELVINSYDADADNCWVQVGGTRILVIDDGIGMDTKGIRDLWHVGHSSKREDVVERARKRKQVGKFGIGKLATAAIANRVTYISKARDADSNQVLSTSVDYSDFKSDPSGGGNAVPLKVRRVTVDDVLRQPNLTEDLITAGFDPSAMATIENGWTIVVLEELKPDATQVKIGRLKWVISTAMPLAPGFVVSVDGTPISSSKLDAERVFEFTLMDLPDERLTSLTKNTRSKWYREGDVIVSSDFPSGVRGLAFVTRQSLYGKSDDLSRSHGFFIRVRGRLVNLDDPLFGLKPSSHAILNRFYCSIECDDLDVVLTAPREGVESSELRDKFILLLSEIFNHARSGYEAWVKENQDDKPKKNREHERNYVNPRLVERPVADALLDAAERAVRERAESPTYGSLDLNDTEPGEWPDDAPATVLADAQAVNQTVVKAGWFYLDLPVDFDLITLTKTLYSDSREASYKYERMALGRSGPMVKFDPTKATFRINQDHDLIRAHDDNPAAQKLLEDVVTAEALLEVYLRSQGLAIRDVEELLSRRDELLRSLTKDRIYSTKAIAADLRDAADNELDLEVQLVVAARALGFLARHIGGDSEPDGIARLLQPGGDEVKITLEAKSSGKQTAGLAAIGFDALQQHMADHEALGCLLVAPGYPGGSKGDQASAAKRAVAAKVSCWTVEQLAAVVENVQVRNISAAQVLDIVLNKHKPEDVARAVQELVSEPKWTDQELYRAVLRALRNLHGKMRGSPRTVDQITARVVAEPRFDSIEMPAVQKAVRDMSAVSNGGLIYDSPDSGRVIINVDLDELERRIAPLLGQPGQPRHVGDFTRNEE